MAVSRTARLLLACVAGGALAALCRLLGAPPLAWALAGAAGVAAAWRAPPAEAAPPPPPADPRPDLAALIEAIDEPVLFVRGQIVSHANAAARALLGTHVVNEDVRLAIRHPAAADRLAHADAAAERGAIPLVGLGERERRWELHVAPVGGFGRLVRLVDRTGAHAAERMRTDFVANASHELRTPLSTLIGFIETLEDEERPADAATRARFLGIMAREARRMQRLIDDLLSLSRIEADRYVAPRDPVDLACLAAEVREAAAPDRIAVAAEPGTPAVTGDRAQLSQLLHNLVGNALKYGRSGTPVRVTIGPAPGGMARLAVADEGEGIAPEHLPRLTERFFRVDPGRSRAIGGTGLGLAIVKHIVERHRGRLEIASEPGRGTTVSVLLPAAASSIRHTDVAEGVAQMV